MQDVTDGTVEQIQNLITPRKYHRRYPAVGHAVVARGIVMDGERGQVADWDCDRVPRERCMGATSGNLRGANPAAVLGE